MSAHAAEEVEVHVLLLGDSEVGKSTLLSRLSLGGRSQKSLPVLRDEDQPFAFDIRFRRLSLRLHFSDTASPTSYALLKPDVIVLCYSVRSRSSLSSLHTTWKYTVETHFNYDETIPVIMLGLKRDLRRENDPESIMPQEALGIAQAMRCDRYCECSAVTGELCAEVFEDLVRTAAATRNEDGGKSQPPPCVLM